MYYDKQIWIGQFKTTIAENGIFRFVFILPEKITYL